VLLDFFVSIAEMTSNFTDVTDPRFPTRQFKFKAALIFMKFSAKASASD